MRSLAQTLFVVAACFFTGYRTYIAWLVPTRHAEHLHEVANLYKGWSEYTRPIVTSRVNFWLTRILYTGAFLLCAMELIDLFVL